MGKWVIRVHVQRGIFFALRRLGFLKMGDRTGNVLDVSRSCANRCQSMNDFCVVIDLSSIDRYQSIPIN